MSKTVLMDGQYMIKSNSPFFHSTPGLTVIFMTIKYTKLK